MNQSLVDRGIDYWLRISKSGLSRRGIAQSGGGDHFFDRGPEIAALPAISGSSFFGLSSPFECGWCICHIGIHQLN